MGNNASYTAFEATVIGAYDLGRLDKALLTVLMEPHRGSDIDSGGCRNLKSKDGKGVEQIVIETWGLEMPQKPEDSGDFDVDDHYQNAIFEQMYAVTKHFGW